MARGLSPGTHYRSLIVALIQSPLKGTLFYVVIKNPMDTKSGIFALWFLHRSAKKKPHGAQ